MSIPATRTFFKDLQQLYKTIETSTDGQATIVGIDEMSVQVSLRPKFGCNAHAHFILTIKGSSGYPRFSPDVTFNSPIFHPNIDILSGSICLSLLNEWQSCHSLLDVVKAMLYLIEHPNFDSANNSFATLDDPSELPKKTARLLAGLPVGGRRFAANTAWCEWAHANDCLPTNEEEVESEETTTRVEKDDGRKEGKRDEADVKDDVGAGVLPLAAIKMNEEVDLENCDTLSVTASDTIPSFAKIRYSIESGDEIRTLIPYERSYVSFDIEAQRILIYQPNRKGTISVYYFLEVLGDQHHRFELDSYSFLFMGNVLYDQQVKESRQCSSMCPWYPFYRNSQSYYTYSTCSSDFLLERLFEVDIPGKQNLTSDFCPWSALDGKGTVDLFGGMFFEKTRHGTGFTCFLDADGSSNEGSEGLGHLFSCGVSDKEEAIMETEEPLDTYMADSETANDIDEIIPDCGTSSAEENYSDDDKLGPQSSKDSLPPSSETFQQTYEPNPTMRNCTFCCYNLDMAKVAVNNELVPIWKLMFRQTRWPIRFAPQQSVYLTLSGICIPPWRVSVGCLMADVCHFCSSHQETKNIVLLDPMALSPLSPLLNLMRHHVDPRPHLTGILWMTPLDALSPFYRVPIPISDQGEVEDRGRDDGYPTPICLRFLAVTAFLTNWVAWLSRIEVYAVLGTSRFLPDFVSVPVAAGLLQPYSLGCGQAAIFDLWPLWLLRRILTTSLQLSSLRFPSLHRRHHHFRFFFPFSDLDEI